MLLGIDVSWWQGLMDWLICREAGAYFAFIRAGSCNNLSGVCYEDFLFSENAEEAPKLMPIGYYWYFRPQHDPLSQANYFCNLLDGADYLLPPVADIEDSGGLSPSAYADSIKQFLDQVEARTGYKPIIYTSSGKWADVEPRPYWDYYDLWVAHYTPNPEPLVPESWNIKGWMFWQHTSEGDAVTFGGPGPPSGDDDIDLNWFNGTEDEFLLYIGAEPIPNIVKVNTIRNAVLYDKIDGKREHIIPNGLHFPVLEVKEAPDERLWYRLGDDWWAVAGAFEIVE